MRCIVLLGRDLTGKQSVEFRFLWDFNYYINFRLLMVAGDVITQELDRGNVCVLPVYNCDLRFRRNVGANTPFSAPRLDIDRRRYKHPASKNVEARGVC